MGLDGRAGVAIRDLRFVVVVGAGRGCWGGCCASDGGGWSAASSTRGEGVAGLERRIARMERGLGASSASGEASL